MDDKPNRRLDDLIHILLQVECDMFISQQSKQVYTCTSHLILIIHTFYTVQACLYSHHCDLNDDSIELISLHSVHNIYA